MRFRSWFTLSCLRLSQTRALTRKSSMASRKPGKTRRRRYYHDQYCLLCDVKGQQGESPVATCWNCVYRHLLRWSRTNFKLQSNGLLKLRPELDLIMHGNVLTVWASSLFATKPHRQILTARCSPKTWAHSCATRGRDTVQKAISNSDTLNSIGMLSGCQME